MRSFTPLVPADVRVLAPFVEAGVLGATDVHLAATIARLHPNLDPRVLLGVAVASRAPGLGHVGIELAAVAERMRDGDQEGLADLPWPDVEGWADALHHSPAVAAPEAYADRPVRPLVWDGTRIYLQRYFHDELMVASDVTRRSGRPSKGPVPPAVLDGLFPPLPDGSPDRQRQAVEVALTSGISVIAGGPGTGKTRTIARLLAAAHLSWDAAKTAGRLDVALAAPTGKAAARMTEAVRGAVGETEADGAIPALLAEELRSAEATTIHRLLGGRPGSRFSHDARNPLPHDLVIVDEASMVALPLMADLLDAVRPDARVVLVGDPDQLASVEAGTVLGDLVGPLRAHRPSPETGAPVATGPLSNRVTVLQRVHRFGADSGIAALAEAVRVGDADAVISLLDGSRADLLWIRPDDHAAVARVQQELVDAGIEVVTAARAGQAADGLEAAARVKVLAATRRGDNGLYDWSARIEADVLAAVPGHVGSGVGRAPGGWYEGRPIMVTVNDTTNRVFNGDVGLAVPGDRGLALALPDGTGVRTMPVARVREVDTWWAMTIHKSQGSEFPHAVVALPQATSPILTRELLYTAVTRARSQVTLVASPDALRRAVDSPVARASGLGRRLWSDAR
ncbi:MAG: exodeoxyribonuclease V subunit alpha [Aquihabitans sp.]